VMGEGAMCSTYSVTLNGGFWYSSTYTNMGSLVGNTLTSTLTGQDLVGARTREWARSYA
jgi:hypothetical protein